MSLFHRERERLVRVRGLVHAFKHLFQVGWCFVNYRQYPTIHHCTMFEEHLDHFRSKGVLEMPMGPQSPLQGRAHRPSMRVCIGSIVKEEPNWLRPRSIPHGVHQRSHTAFTSSIYVRAAVEQPSDRIDVTERRLTVQLTVKVSNRIRPPLYSNFFPVVVRLVISKHPPNLMLIHVVSRRFDLLQLIGSEILKRYDNADYSDRTRPTSSGME